MRTLQEHTGPSSNRGYILPSLVLVFALMLSTLAYTNYQRDQQEISAADVTLDAIHASVNPNHADQYLNAIPASAGVDRHEEQIRQLEQWLSRTRDELEQRLEELEKQLAKRTVTHANDMRDSSTAEHSGNDELLENLELWQESVNRQIGRVQDGFEASIESLEARISNTAQSSDYVYTYQPESAQIEQLEQQLASFVQRLTQITDAHATRIEHMANSLEYLSASRDASQYKDTSPASVTHETQQPLLQEQINHVTSQYDARLKSVEMRLAEADLKSKRRFEDIEKSLGMTAEHLDSLTKAVAAATALENSAALIAANETITTQPPAAIQQEPATVSRAEKPTTDRAREPEAPAQPAIARQDISVHHIPVATRTWSINLASYVREEMAKEKLEAFREKGIEAEIAAALVRGKTMYRLRVTGFDNLEAAKSRTPEIKQKLGLNEAWISRN